MAQSLLGVALFSVLAVPVLLNIVKNPDFGSPQELDYIHYLREWYPFHFLFDANTAKAKIALGIICALGIVSFRAYGQTAHAFIAAILGYGFVYVAGIATPHITHSWIILNLHLLRAGMFFHIFAALGALTLSIRLISGESSPGDRVVGLLLILCVCSVKYMIPVALLLVATRQFFVGAQFSSEWVGKHSMLASTLTAVILIACQVYVTAKTRSAHAGVQRFVDSYSDIGRWARTNTPVHSMFLVPTRELVFENASDHSSKQDDLLAPGFDSAIFQYASHRQTWVTFKGGAAVMWSPSYYKTWHARITEVLNLNTLDDKLTYSASNGIDFVLDFCEQAKGHSPSYRAGALCVFPVQTRRS